MSSEQAGKTGLSEQPLIALATPTGKAAQRLAQAIAKGETELQSILSPQPTVEATSIAIAPAGREFRD